VGLGEGEGSTRICRRDNRRVGHHLKAFKVEGVMKEERKMALKKKKLRWDESLEGS